MPNSLLYYPIESIAAGYLTIEHIPPQSLGGKGLLFEIECAVGECKIPIIVVYLDVVTPIHDPSKLLYKLPRALRTRIENGTVSAIHIPFKKLVILDAVSQFLIRNYLWVVGLEDILPRLIMHLVCDVYGALT